ncbi:hypothetical protein [Paraburkholderia sp. MM5384-R2]|uniref:hypothetical protein n=1 Tax=Paraburkholderia sp. MM5384-R2 TaxID=2723097 RepID=UPI001608E27E|nr:hypothetical protein [Paraburkholderia sp. MM5384-R2]MBB5501558.1 hypothetical protein [Paraburkholderia sp. MM5384-R2]
MREPGTLPDWIRALMKDGRARTAAQIAAVIDARPRSVRAVLSKWLESGEIHVCASVGTSHERLYRIGPGDGTLPPQLQAREASESAMTVLAVAIDAMVRGGKR